jgi:integrase
MSVRKRTWTSGNEEKTAWVVNYTADGRRHLKTFARKKEADAYHDRVRGAVRDGKHVAPSRSSTVKDAAKAWLVAVDTEGELERGTLLYYEGHVRLHINPYLGDKKLSSISTATVREFASSLRANGRSADMVRRVLINLGAIIANAQEQGLTGHNAVRDLRSNRRKRNSAKRHKRKLEVGVDIPSYDEFMRIYHTASRDRWIVLLVVAAFTGLRASELRGIRWKDVDLDVGELHVRQRADRFNKIGPPKTAASQRTVPFDRYVAKWLKRWKLACPKGPLDLVFPNASGNVESLGNITARCWYPIQIAAGVVTKERKPKYVFHSLRHFFASLCINPRERGGLGLSPKEAQEWLGHSNIAMTFDTYGHLFPRSEDNRDRFEAVTSKLLA